MRILEELKKELPADKFSDLAERSKTMDIIKKLKREHKLVLLSLAKAIIDKKEVERENHVA